MIMNWWGAYHVYWLLMRDGYPTPDPQFDDFSRGAATFGEIAKFAPERQRKKLKERICHFAGEGQCSDLFISSLTTLLSAYTGMR